MNALRLSNRLKPHKGFTLIELVIGMLVFAIAMTFFISLIVPQATRSIDPIFQVRATELGQSLLNEISGKSFDENSSRNTSQRCGDVSAPTCTLPSALGPDGEARGAYNDVDLNGRDDGVVGVAKLITVTITTPNNEDLVFSTYRYNY